MRWWFGLMAFITLSYGCTQHGRKVEPAFYYWKTVYQADETEQAYLSGLGAKRLFVRIMDVDNQGPNGEPIPVSPIVFKDTLRDSLQLVPVVFIANQVLKDRTEAELDGLAERVSAFVLGKIKQAGKSEFDELQIDCDWTASTREAYFHLLNRIRQRMPAGTLLSATLRLHQVRNPQSSGTPPVDKVLLMCYNMGNLRRFGPQNSILDINEMRVYLKGYLRAYPLPMDVALPLFSWSVVFRDGQYAGISKRLDPALLSDTALFNPLDDTSLFRLKAPLPQAGLRKRDIIRREHVGYADVRRAARFLADELPATDFTLLYYHLDKNLLTGLPAETRSASHVPSPQQLFTHASLQEIIDCF